MHALKSSLFAACNFLRRTKTLERVMVATKGIGPGFDLLRLSLAILILYAHTRLAITPNGIVDLFDGTVVAKGETFISNAELDFNFFTKVKSKLYILYVPMFFALSGFLVMGSAARNPNALTFLSFRALRIFPALAVETVLSAIVLGLFFSSLPPSVYILDPAFYRYFGNIIGLIQFELPGVFTNNPAAGLVNPNLWTLPAEFYCYLVLSSFIFLKFLKRRFFLLILLTITSLVLIFASLKYGMGLSRSVLTTTAVVYYFFVGAMFYIWRDWVPMNTFLFFVAVAGTVYMMIDPIYTFAMPIFLTYVTIYLGHASILALHFMKGRDYSYGIYLYGFPITQAIVALNPAISRVSLFVFALTITTAFAIFSWHLIEKPALRFKRDGSSSLLLSKKTI